MSTRASRHLLLTTILAASAYYGCAHEESAFVWVDDLKPQALEPVPYVIQPGDQVNIAVWNQANLSTLARVRLDGRATVPLVGDVMLAGFTAPGASLVITKMLQGLVLNPRVTVSVLETRPATLTVLGEVKTPGSYPVLMRDTLLDMLAKAGGLTEFASEDGIYLIRRGSEPQRIRFDYGRLTAGEGRGIRFRLEDGDIIVVR
jgi:polysaccharide biosynthesis/export protein